MIAAVILAAGQSRRMGRPKMLLPWGRVTVIEQVVTTFLRAGLEEIVVVTGGAREHVQTILAPYPVQLQHNPDYAYSEMLASLQYGIRGLSESAEAVLVGLGDQPQVEESTVRLLCSAYRSGAHALIVPSFQHRRGHPWLVARSLWGDVLGLGPAESPRIFLNRHARAIHYVNVDHESVLADLDTPEDYNRSHPD